MRGNKGAPWLVDCGMALGLSVLTGGLGCTRRSSPCPEVSGPPCAHKEPSTSSWQGLGPPDYCPEAKFSRDIPCTERKKERGLEY